MKSRAVLEVNLSLLKKNCLTLKKMAGNSFFCPMIKANAYGHGAVLIAKALLSAGVRRAGVLSAGEAWPIRELAGDLDLVIFGPVLDKEDLSWILEENLALLCCSWEDLKRLSQFKKPCRIHLKFDTGFSRLGFALPSAPEIYDFLKERPYVKLEGLATQLVAGEELGDGQSFSARQLERFSGLKDFFPGQAFHALNSAALTALFAHGAPADFGARPGISLYGIKPPAVFKNERAKERWRGLRLFPVSRLKSYVVDLRTIPKGAPVSYGGLWKAPRPSQIATVSLGYGDGFLRSAGASREVLFRGKKRSVVGAVCMDFFMMDVTDCAKEGGGPVEPGEEAVIFGSQGELFLSPQAQAEALGSIPYELFSRLGDRVERAYKA